MKNNLNLAKGNNKIIKLIDHSRSILLDYHLPVRSSVQRLMQIVAYFDKSKFMICSDFLSCLLSIESCKTQNPFILKIVEIYKSLVTISKHVIFTWIPSRIGIHGNTVVDLEAKKALDDPVSKCSIPYYDFKPCIMKYILKRWQDSWDQQIHNKLHEIHSIVGKIHCSYGHNRKEQVVLTRCRI